MNRAEKRLNRRLIALHEAGHVIVPKALGLSVDWSTTLFDGKNTGSTMVDGIVEDEIRAGYLMWIKRLSVMAAGMAAEGSRNGASEGDMENVSNFVAQIKRMYNGPLNEYALGQKAMQVAMMIVETNRPLLLRVRDALLKYKRLEKAQIDTLCADINMVEFVKEE